MAKRKVVWIVEMFNDARGRWEPTVGVGLNRDDGREALARWVGRNRSNRFRLRCYTRGPQS